MIRNVDLKALETSGEEMEYPSDGHQGQRQKLNHEKGLWIYGHLDRMNIGGDCPHYLWDKDDSANTTHMFSFLFFFKLTYLLERERVNE